MHIRQPRDDLNIRNEEPLYRTIPAIQIDNGRVLSSAFKSRTNPHPSVDRSRLSTPEETLARKPHHAGVAQVLTGFVRSVTVGVASDPLPDNPAHALIIRDPACGSHEWRRIARKLAKACEWAISPSRAA